MPEQVPQSPYVETFDVEKVFGNADGVDAGEAWRLSTLRRVLGYVTDEEHVDDRVYPPVQNPRNTHEFLLHALSRDPDTRLKADEGDRLQVMLDRLVSLGLLDARDDGSYGVTDNGWHELTH